MGDIHCAKCGEPWEYYTVRHEFTKEESEKFFNREGCPCCDWGKDIDNEPSKSEQRLRFVKDIDNNTDLDPLSFL